MERTIDGIDYIRKSTVLTVIDDEIRTCDGMLERLPYTDPNVALWEERIIALNIVRERLEYLPGK